MAAKSYYLDNAILDHVLRNTALVSPLTVHVGLFTVAPTPGLAGTEVVGGDYQRVAVTMGAPANGVCSNSAPVAFPTAAAPWGTVVACGIFDDPVAGNLLYFGNLGVQKVVGLGDQVNFIVGALSVTEA